MGFIIVLMTAADSSFKVVVAGLYTVWIRINETLPWIELKGEYHTRREARQAAEQTLRNTLLKIVNIPQESRSIKALATTRISR